MQRRCRILEMSTECAKVCSEIGAGVIRISKDDAQAELMKTAMGSADVLRIRSRYRQAHLLAVRVIASEQQAALLRKVKCS